MKAAKTVRLKAKAPALAAVKNPADVSDEEFVAGRMHYAAGLEGDGPMTILLGDLYDGLEVIRAAVLSGSVQVDDGAVSSFLWSLSRKAEAARAIHARELEKNRQAWLASRKVAEVAP